MKKLLLPILLIAIWTLASINSNPLFIPKPEKVLSTFIGLIENGMLVKSLSSSFIRITIATLITCAISLPFAFLVTNVKILNEMVTPLTNMLRYLPVTAFYPLLILWAGIGEQMKVTFLVCATIFYFLPSIVLCIKEIDERLIDTAKTMGMNKWQIITHVQIPYTLPSICKSILMMYGIGWTYIAIAEMTNCTSGLGYIINIGSARGRTDMVFVSIFVIMLVSYVFDRLGDFLIRKGFSWKFAKEN